MAVGLYASKDTGMEYTDDPRLEQLGHLIVKMPDLTGGIQRRVELSFQFGDTELRVEATDVTSGERNSLRVDLDYTYSSD
jgi:hypothetical protein